MGKVFKDKPMSEITLRRFERPFNEEVETLIRRFCISLGLLQPGDSRDVVVDVFKIVLQFSKERKIISSKDIETQIKLNKKLGVSGSNIRRQLLRLETVGLIEKFEGGYRTREFSNLKFLIDNYVKKYTIEPILERIQEYAQEIDRKL